MVCVVISGCGCLRLWVLMMGGFIVGFAAEAVVWAGLFCVSCVC